MCSSRKECWGQWKTGGTVLSASLVITNKTECDCGYLQPLQVLRSSLILTQR